MSSRPHTDGAYVAGRACGHAVTVNLRCVACGEYVGLPWWGLVRLSIPGNVCVHCRTLIGESLTCPGCGWLDPMTASDDEVSP